MLKNLIVFATLLIVGTVNAGHHHPEVAAPLNGNVGDPWAVCLQTCTNNLDICVNADKLED